MISLEEYKTLREEIALNNQNLVGVVLNDDEKKADKKLSELKKKFSDTCGETMHYSMSAIRDERIRESELYEFIRKLPKGSDLHVHGTSLIPVNKMIDFLCDYEKLLINIKTYVLTFENGQDTYPLKKALNEGLITKEELNTKWTTLGCQDKKGIWNYFEELFERLGAIDLDNDLLKKYYVFAFEYYVSLKIYHVEIHVLLSKNQEETNSIINIIKEAYFEVKKKHNELVVSIIGTSMKMFESIEETKEIFNCTIKAQETIKDDFDSNNIHDFVLGMDLINEEDKSRPLIEYASLLLEIRNKYPNFNYYLHCGESINTRNDNLIDAYLLDAKRVGHGTNLYRYPDLLKKYADKEICLESCLISNQVLRYVKDLRLHPSAEYLKRGVTIALCSDDPVFFEYDTLVDDFFAAIVCWDLGIAEVKHLCINSIMYSGLDNISKKKLMEDWHVAWKGFIKGQI